MFQIYGITVIFYLQLWGDSEKTKRTKRLVKKELKKELIDSLTTSNVIETEQLNEKAKKVEKPEDGADVIKQYEEVIRVKKKDIISIAHHQGKMFKRFRKKEKFIKLVSELKVHKSTGKFKINIFELIDKYPKLMNSSATLGFFLRTITRILNKFAKKIQASLNK